MLGLHQAQAALYGFAACADRFQETEDGRGKVGLHNRTVQSRTM